MIITIGVGLILAAFYNFVNKWTSYFGKKIFKPNRKKRKVKKPSLTKIKARKKRNEPKNLPPFNHPDSNKSYRIGRVSKDRIGKHPLIPVYIENNRVAVITQTSKSAFGKQKNVKIAKNKYAGNELHYEIMKKDLNKKDFDNRKVVSIFSRKDEEILESLNNNPKNKKKYVNFLNKNKK